MSELNSHLGRIGQVLRFTRRNGRDDAIRRCANWLRRQANAETDPAVRAVFIEAHNAVLAMKDDHESAGVRRT